MNLGCIFFSSQICPNIIQFEGIFRLLNLNFFFFWGGGAVASALGQQVSFSYSVIVDVISNAPLVCGK